MPINGPLPVLGADVNAPFPAPGTALRDPNGLLAIGGDLSPQRLLNAYRQGIFPWYGEGQPILWWSPDPRMVFSTGVVHLSRRFRRTLRASDWILRMDSAFPEVIRACAESPRRGQVGTWITDDMRRAYTDLHARGIAHSLEVFAGKRLVGGLYGLAIGRMFFAESMFSRESGGSKVALAALAHTLHMWGWPLIDAQVESAHLKRMGACIWPRDVFLAAIAPLVAAEEPDINWHQRFGEYPARTLGVICAASV